MAARRAARRADRMGAAPGWRNGKRGRLKIAWPLAVQVRVLPRAPDAPKAPASLGRPAAGAGAVDRAERELAQRIPRPRDPRAHIVRREQVFEGVPVEQRRAQIALGRPVDLDPKDLLGVKEDLTDSQALFDVALQDLGAQRVDDASFPITAERGRGQGILCIVAAAFAAAKFEAAWGSHGSFSIQGAARLVQAGRRPGIALRRLRACAADERVDDRRCSRSDAIGQS